VDSSHPISSAVLKTHTVRCSCGRTGCPEGRALPSQAAGRSCCLLRVASAIQQRWGEIERVIQRIKGCVFSPAGEPTWLPQQGLTQGSAEECGAWTSNSLSIRILSSDQLQEDREPKDKPSLYFMPLSGGKIWDQTVSRMKKRMLIALLLSGKGVGERKHFSKSHRAKEILFFHLQILKAPWNLHPTQLFCKRRKKGTQIRCGIKPHFAPRRSVEPSVGFWNSPAITLRPHN